MADSLVVQVMVAAVGVRPVAEGVPIVGGVVSVTVNVNVVVWVAPPPVAVIVMVEVPVGVVAWVVRVRVDEQVGLQLGEEKEAEALVGRPEAEKETAWVEPEARVAVIVEVPELP